MVRGGLIRIVIVDDDDDLRDIASQTLTNDPRFVVAGVGTTGYDAVDLVRSERVDVVLLDLEMPWLDGAEAVPLIRRSSPRTTILVWTVDPDGARAGEAVQMGATRVLSKAYFSPSELPDQLCRILGRETAPRPAGSARGVTVATGHWA